MGRSEAGSGTAEGALARALGVWRAATWGERLQRAQAAAGVPDRRGDERARRRVEVWARAFADGDLAALERRLGWDGLSLGAAAALLEGDVRPSVRTPAWLAAGVARRLLEDGGSAEIDKEPESARLVATWAAAARERLLERSAVARSLSAAALDATLARLERDLARASGRALAELRVSKRPPAEARGSLLSLYARYPVLLRQSERLVATFVDALAELLERWARDRAPLGATFGAPFDQCADEIAAIEPLDSDRHGGGRQVARIRFAGGLAVVYKPRPLAAEAAWSALVASCRAAGLGEDAPAVAQVLERDDYGWMESVEAGAPDGEAATALWFRRAGATVAFADLLGAEDLHRENLIATPHGPVAVDLELLLLPARGESDLERGSWLSTGLLAAAGGAAVSDRVGRHAAFAPGGVLPRLHGREVSLADHAEALAAGYASAYRHLLARRQELLAPGGPLARLSGVSVRVLLRPTADYGRALDELASPAAQSDPSVAPLLLERGLADFAAQLERPRLWPLVAPEREALEGLDVPRFETTAGERAVRCGGVEVDGLFVASGVERLRRRFALWSEDDLTQQLLALREVGASAEERREPPWRALAAADEGLEGAAVGARDAAVRATALAVALARHLAARRLAHTHELDLESADAATEVRRLSLYDGVAGEALTLSALAKVAPGPELDEAARRARAELAARLDRFDPTGAPVGGFQGLGSMIWALVWIDRFDGGEIDPLAAAARLARALDAERLAADRRLDVEGGCAGAILALLALAEADGGAGWLARARAAGERLLATADLEGGGLAWRGELGRPLAGFAHGASGIARALGALSTAIGDARFADAAAGALRFERSLYDPERRNWPVLLAGDRPEEPRRRWMTAWCHGAAGVALARTLLVAGGRADAGTETDLELALAATRDVAEPGDDHLCCGAAGRASILAYAGAALGRPAELAAAHDVVGGVVARAAARGGLSLPRPRDPASGAAWGLMRGRAGVAWAAAELGGMLSETALPSPLALELPSERARRGR